MNITTYPYTKKCPICERNFIIKDFSQAGRKYCYSCSPRGRKGDYTSLYKNIKIKLVEMKGGKCQKCGYDKCIGALQFHHRNPEEKSFELSMKSGHCTWEEMSKEAEKCDLLCANCHSELHYNMNTEEDDEDENDFSEEEIVTIKPKYYCIDCKEEISTSTAQRCSKCAKIASRTVERPSREELKNLIRTVPFTQIAKQYNVSDKAIAKWCIAENLPSRKKDIKSYSDEEWDLL